MVAISRSAVPGDAAPATAADDLVGAISVPCAAVSRCAVIANQTLLSGRTLYLRFSSINDVL